MDKDKMPASKNFEDRTAENTSPMIKWLLQQPSSKAPLTEAEKDFLSTGNWGISDIYFNRYIQGNTEHMLTKGYYDRQEGERLMEQYLKRLMSRKKQ